MTYLETISQLDNYTKKGLINIAKYNRDLFIAYNRIGKEDLVEYIEKIFQDGHKIKIPLFQEDEIIKCNYKSQFCLNCGLKLHFRTYRGNRRNTVKGSTYCNDCIRDLDMFLLC